MIQITAYHSAIAAEVTENLPMKRTDESKSTQRFFERTRKAANSSDASWVRERSIPADFASVNEMVSSAVQIDWLHWHLKEDVEKRLHNGCYYDIIQVTSSSIISGLFAAFYP